MKKLYATLSAAALLLSGAPSAYAEGPAKTALPGIYSFSATVTCDDEAMASVLQSSYEFEIYLDGGQYGPVTVNRFVTEGSGPYDITYYPAYGTFDFRSTNLGTVNGTMLAFKSASSKYEELTWNVSSSGAITSPDFLIINGRTGATVATYSDVVITKVSGGDDNGNDKEENKAFIGTHSIPGWWVADYTKGDGKTYTVSSGNNVSLTINDNYQLTSIAGLDVESFLLDSGFDTGVVTGNVWQLELTSFGGVLDMDYETGVGKYLSGSLRRNQEAPNFESIMKLTYDEAAGTFSLTDFTVWQKVLTAAEGEEDEDGNIVGGDTEVSWKLLYYYSTSEITGGTSGEEPGDDTDDNADASIEGKWNFTFNGHYLGSDSLGTFTEEYVARLEGTIVTFEGPDIYNVIAEFKDPQTLEFTQCAVGVPAAYTLWQSPFINTTGTNNLQSLTEQSFTASYDAEAGTISFPEGAGLRYGRFDAAGELQDNLWADAFDFVKASRVGSSSGVGSINTEVSVPTEYFNLQGVKVNNPSNGIFIRVQGNKSSKVIVK